MSPAPDPALPTPALAGFPPEVREAFKRFRANGDRRAAETVVIAAAVDYRPASAGLAPPVADETRLLEDLGYDSVAVAELVFFLEDVFDMTISNEDVLAVRTIADLRRCVMGKLAGRGGAA
jgi:acyl carrier protein